MKFIWVQVGYAHKSLVDCLPSDMCYRRIQSNICTWRYLFFIFITNKHCFYNSTKNKKAWFPQEWTIVKDYVDNFKATLIIKLFFTTILCNRIWLTICHFYINPLLFFFFFHYLQFITSKLWQSYDTKTFDPTIFSRH